MSGFIKSIFQSKKQPLPEYKPKSEATIQSEERIRSMDKAQVEKIIVQEIGVDFLKESSMALEISEIGKIGNFEELTNRIGVLSYVQDIVRQGISKELVGKNETLVEGFNQVAEIQDEIDVSKQFSELSRIHLENVQNIITKQLIQLLKLYRKKANIQKLIGITQNFGDIGISASRAIKSAIHSGELYTALVLCNKADEQLSQIEMSQFLSLASARTNIVTKRNEIYALATSQLTQLTTQFDPVVYENALLVLTSNSTAFEVSMLIQEEFVKNISAVYRENFGFGELAIGTKPLEAMRRSFSQISYILYNNHRFSEWHEDTDYPVSLMNLTRDDLTTIIQF